MKSMMMFPNNNNNNTIQQKQFQSVWRDSNKRRQNFPTAIFFALVVMSDLSRSELLRWLNDLLSLEYTRIEDTANGVAFCLLIDRMHPGKVPLHLVRMEASLSHEIDINYKILLDCFASIGLKLELNLKRLSSGVFIDLLQLLQILKRYYDQQQNKAQSTPAKSRSIPTISHSSAKKPITPAPSRTTIKHKPIVTTSTPLSSRPRGASVNEDQPTKVQPACKSTDDKLLKVLVDMEKERDYYFSKLLKIEKIIASNEDEICNSIRDVLYDKENTS